MLREVKIVIDKELLEILACPACKGNILYDQEKEKLVCQKCNRRYPIRDGIPVMLIEEAEIISEKGEKTQK
jgi:uncharacterized protein YbaR (Trm112 family)